MKTLFSLVYDCIIILSIMILLTFPLVIINHGQAFEPGNMGYSLFLVLLTLAYFYFMTKFSNQTIGMKAWRFRYQRHQNTPLGLALCIRYFLYIPISFYCLFKERPRELLLSRCCGIQKVIDI